jgi:hypothetical protein
MSLGKSERYEKTAARRPFARSPWCPHGVHRRHAQALPTEERAYQYSSRRAP